MDARTDEYYVGPFSYSEGFAVSGRCSKSLELMFIHVFCGYDYFLHHHHMSIQGGILSGPCMILIIDRKTGDMMLTTIVLNPYQLLQIAVHDKDEEPIVNGLSYAAGVNADTFIVVNRKEVNISLENKNMSMFLVS